MDRFPTQIAGKAIVKTGKLYRNSAILPLSFFSRD
jgi:hypothetical protein